MNYMDLLNNEAFMAKLSEAKNIGEVKDLFAEEGVTVTEDEMLDSILPSGDELDEESLESVAGGASASSIFFGWLSQLLKKRRGGGGGHRF